MEVKNCQGVHNDRKKIYRSSGIVIFIANLGGIFFCEISSIEIGNSFEFVQ